VTDTHRTQCRACHGNTVNTFLCQPCQRRLTAALRDIPALLAELDITISRQDRTGAPLYATKRGEIPGVHYPDDAPATLPATQWPFAWDAANERASVLATLGVWAREVGQRLDAAAVPAIARHPLAAKILDEVLYARDSIVRAIDRPEPDLFLGRCTAVNAEVVDVDGVLTPTVGECGSDLLGRTGDERARCGRCGTVYTISTQNAELLEKVNDEWAPAHVIAHALSTRDEPLNASTLRTWIDRDARVHASGRLVDYPLVLRVGTDDEGRAVYRVGDVRARIAWSRARRADKITA
jgi:hypothetical protein